MCRILEKAASAASADEKLALQRLHRRLTSVHEELEIYNSLLQRFKDAPRYDWESITALHRRDLIPSFFDHLQNILGGLASTPTEQSGISYSLSTLCWSVLCEMSALVSYPTSDVNLAASQSDICTKNARAWFKLGLNMDQTVQNFQHKLCSAMPG